MSLHFVVWSAVDDDVTAGLLQRKNPRHHCLAYRRKLRSTVVRKPKKKSKPDGVEESPCLKREELWQKVQHHLGPSQAREYAVIGSPRHGQLAEDDESYLRRLCDDFVMDIEALVRQRMSQPRPAAPSDRLVTEVLHHAGLATAMLQADGDSDRYSGLLRRLQSYVMDQRQSCRPFVIHGETLAAMSAVADAVPHWLSATGLVTVLRCIVSGLVTVLRFLGTTTDSTDVETCVASVRAEIEASYSLRVSRARGSLYCELTALRAVMEHVSRSFGHTQPLVILLDGVDALQPHRDALEALWAVRHLPSSIYVIMSVSGGYERTGSVQPLLALITDRELTYDLSGENAGERRLSTDPLDVLSSTLDTLEADFGPTIVKYFAVYVTIMVVGILDSELYDLLATNDHVMAEHSHVSFTPGLVSILRHRLAPFLATRLVCGCPGFFWSRLEYRQAVAERYHVTVGGADKLCEKLNDFTVTVHQHVVQMYQDVTVKSSVAGASTSFSGESGVAVRASRLIHHLRALLPVTGVSDIKARLLFNVDWLLARLATSSVSQTITDVLSVYDLSQQLRRRAVLTDSCDDVRILLEFLQLSSAALAVNHLCLPAEVVARFDHPSLTNMYQSVSDLVVMSRRWLTDTDASVLVPLWSVWDRPGGVRRHVLDGLTHVVGCVDGGQALVGYSRGRLSVWRVQTGLKLHELDVSDQQVVSGLVAAHTGAFIITSCYSHVTKTTQLNVLSTELGLSLLSLSLPHQLEALALSDDDQMLALSSVSNADKEPGDELTRTLLAVDLAGRDVVFQLPVVNVHAEGRLETNLHRTLHTTP